MQKKPGYRVYALITVTLWSLAFVFTRIALAYFTPLPLGFVRYVAASAALVAVLILRRIGLPPRAALPVLLLSGAAGFFGYMVTFNLGSQTVEAATSCTVIAASPLLTALLARIVYKEKLTPLQSVSMLISFAGVVLLTVMKLRLTPGPGLLYIIGAALLLSVYSLLQRRLTRLCAPLQATAYSIFFGTLLLGVFAPQALRELPSVPAKGLLCVAALGVLCGAVAYCCWTKALSLADNTASVSNYMFIEPFLTAVLGLLLAGERLDAATLLGGAVILLGLGLFYFGKPLWARLAGPSRKSPR